MANPIKKRKNGEKIINNIVNFNNILFSNKVLLNNNNISNKDNITKFNEEHYPYNMNRSQMYEIILKINGGSDSELKDLDYNSAIKIDKRTFFQYYISLLRTKHLLFFSFCPSFD